MYMYSIKKKKNLKTKVPAPHVKTTMTLLVSLASCILASLHLHTSHIFTITTVHFLTIPSHLGIQETIYHLFHCALFHSAEDKGTIIV